MYTVNLIYFCLGRLSVFFQLSGDLHYLVVLEQSLCSQKISLMEMAAISKLKICMLLIFLLLQLLCILISIGFSLISGFS